MMILPFPPHRSHLLAFWAGLHLAAGLLATLLWPVLGTPLPSAALLVALAATLALGALRPEPVLFGYRAWNRAARLTGWVLESWVLLVLHRVVLTLVRLSGPSLPFGTRGTSTWEEYALRPDEQGRIAPGGSLAGQLLRESRQPGRGWWLGLIPFLLLLAWVAPQQEEDLEVPGNLYTLF